MYKEMKTLTGKINGVNVYYSNSEFKRYSIELTGGYDASYVYKNNKPTIKELKEYKLRYDKENGNA